MATHTRRIELRLTPEQWQWLTGKARVYGTRSAALRLLLEQAMSQQPACIERK